MAESKNNQLTYGLSGKIGSDFVFRQRNGKTIVSSAPGKRNGNGSEEQQACNHSFKAAVGYGKAVNQDEVLKKDYKENTVGHESSYHAAIADFMRPPEILDISVDEASDGLESVISIKAGDDFRVNSVFVSIYATDDTLIDEGEASLNATDQVWVYLSIKGNDSLTGCRLRVIVTDTPGNNVSREIVL